MKRVTLYKAVPEVVNVFGEHILRHEYQKGIRCANSDDWFHADQVNIRTHRIPIMRFQYRDENTYDEWYTAFDPELQRLIDLQVNERVAECTRQLHHWQATLGKEIQDLKSRTIVGMIKFKIKEWWNK